MVTALPDPAARKRGILLGADDFLTKPFDRWELRARLGTLLRLARAQRALVEQDRLIWVMDRSERGYGLIDAADRLRYANSSFRRMVGLGADAALDIAFVRALTATLRIADRAQWKHFDAWDELCGPIELQKPGVAGQAGTQFSLWVHAGPVPNGWRVVELSQTPSVPGWT
jgi:PAS domain-containing protein